jgi:pimeloyl-ACP methyl ester carboxylesterase
MTTTTDRVRSIDGTDIAYTVIGSGPTLVIVNGAMGHRDSHPTEGLVAQALADRYTVITYDRRGRGDSGATDPTLAAADAVRAEVADIAALTDRAGGQATVVGFSSGGVLALEAVQAGLPISALALWEPPFVVTADRPPLATDYRTRLQRALADGRPGDALAMFFIEPSQVPEEFVEQMRKEPFWHDLEQIAPSLANDAAIMGDGQGGDPTILERYATVAVPTLVLHGGASPAWFAPAAAALAAVLPNATTRELPGQDHDVSPDMLVAALTEWLA